MFTAVLSGVKKVSTSRRLHQVTPFALPAKNPPLEFANSTTFVPPVLDCPSTYKVEPVEDVLFDLKTPNADECA